MTTPESPVDETEDVGEAPVPLDAPEELTEPSKPNREERFRTRAQAAETRVAELEAAAAVHVARAEEMNRRTAERSVSDILANPEELWRDGTRLSALLDDVGVISEEAARARAAELAGAHPYLRAPKPQATPAASIVTGDGKPGGSTGWEGAFGAQR